MSGVLVEGRRQHFRVVFSCHVFFRVCVCVCVIKLGHLCLHRKHLYLLSHLASPCNYFKKLRGGLPGAQRQALGSLYLIGLCVLQQAFQVGLKCPHLTNEETES